MNECNISKVVLVIQQPSYIGEVIGRAIVISKMTNALVYFMFNGVKVVCTKYDKVADVMAYYDEVTKEKV